MMGEKIKEIADKLPYTSRELAEKMEMSSATLYAMYKREHVKDKYLSKFSQIANVPVSELKRSNLDNANDLENLKQENEKLKQENKEIKKENSYLSKKLEKVESKLQEIQDALTQKFLGIELNTSSNLGKAKASSKKATLPTNEELNLFSLNFGG